MDRPATALACWGVTLIPPESLEQLIDVIQSNTTDEFKSDALEITELLIQAKAQNKHVIHYGV